MNPPMLRRRHHAALDRVVVQILQLLPHHLIVSDRLRMDAFLPDLMLGRLRAMRGAVIGELVELSGSGHLGITK